LARLISLWLYLIGGDPRHRVELADDATYNHYRAEVLKFLYERQRRPEDEVAGGTPKPSMQPVDGGQSGNESGNNREAA